MGKLILVRHGETDWNSVRRIQGGGSDTPLNETGKQQAENLAIRLRDERIQAIYSSPQQRALHTAQAIARYHNLEVTVLRDLREIEVGELEGKTRAEVGLRFDELLVPDGANELPKIPGGESLTDLQKRAWSTVKGLVSTQSDGAVVVVTHYFVIMAIVCAVINLPLTQIRRLRLTPGTITTVAFEEHGCRLEMFNAGCQSQ